jgi:hypothetical protein
MYVLLYLRSSFSAQQRRKRGDGQSKARREDVLMQSKGYNHEVKGRYSLLQRNLTESEQHADAEAKSRNGSTSADACSIG